MSGPPSPLLSLRPFVFQPQGPPRLYSYPSCSTCRQALAWLRQQGVEVEVFDISRQPPSLEELEAGLQQLGRSRLFNTSGQSYRALGSAAVKAFTDAEALRALAGDGKLIKRPYLITATGHIGTGFKVQEWISLLGQVP